LGRFERPAARLVTGPAGFFIAGLVDVAAVLWWLTARRLRSRSLEREASRQPAAGVPAGLEPQE
jgi:hypothetical protein